MMILKMFSVFLGILMLLVRSHNKEVATAQAKSRQASKRKTRGDGLAVPSVFTGRFHFLPPGYSYCRQYFDIKYVTYKYIFLAPLQHI